MSTSTTDVQFRLPAIGQHWPGQGGIFKGIVRGRNGQPDHFLIEAETSRTLRLTWNGAVAWAKGLEVDGHRDFTLPNRSEGAQLFANKDEGDEAWIWLSEKHSASYAWYCYFYGGNQYHDHKSYEGSARAVRRLPIDPSILLAAAS